MNPQTCRRNNSDSITVMILYAVLSYWLVLLLLPWLSIPDGKVRLSQIVVTALPLCVGIVLLYRNKRGWGLIVSLLSVILGVLFVSCANRELLLTFP
jgi:TctA family transporter